MSEPSAAAVGFRVWVRRLDVPDTPFAVRFEVRSGKGVLRVSRPGVLIDPPARPAGLEDRLTAGQLRASRFLHAWPGGRCAHLFVRLEEIALEGLETGEWVELAQHLDAGVHYLQLASGERNATEMEAEEGESTPLSQKMILQDFTRELRQLVERTRPTPPPPPPDADDPIEAPSETEEIEKEEARRATAAATKTAARKEAEAAKRAAATPALAQDDGGRSERVTLREVRVFLPPATSTPTAVVAPPTPIAAAPPTPTLVPPSHVAEKMPLYTASDPAQTVHARSTTLVRHFRRRIAEDAARIQGLEARVLALEAQLGSKRAGDKRG